MFKRSAIRTAHTDETCSYNIILDEDYTVKSFIDAIIQNIKSEWGNITIVLSNGKRRKLCTYDYGKLVGKIPKEYAGKTVKEAKSRGGWTVMDYYIYV